MLLARPRVMTPALLVLVGLTSTTKPNRDMTMPQAHVVTPVGSHESLCMNDYLRKLQSGIRLTRNDWNKIEQTRVRTILVCCEDQPYAVTHPIFYCRVNFLFYTVILSILLKPDL